MRSGSLPGPTGHSWGISLLFSAAWSSGARLLTGEGKAEEEGREAGHPLFPAVSPANQQEAHSGLQRHPPLRLPLPGPRAYPKPPGPGTSLPHSAASPVSSSFLSALSNAATEQLP